MTLHASIDTPKVTVHDGKAVTTSKDVADYFGKLHKDVLKKIDSLDCSPAFASANFCAHVQKVDIGNGATRDSKIYEMTKDGFVFLVMGFTGKKAAAFKEAYISEFNRMEAECQLMHTGYSRRNAEPLDNNDTANLKWLINCVTTRFKYQNSWNAAIWHALRTATGTPSPHPFSVDDIAVLTEECRRILSVTSHASALICQFEKDVMRKVIRNRKDYEAIASRMQSEFDALHLPHHRTQVLQKFEEAALLRLVQRQH